MTILIYDDYVRNKVLSSPQMITVHSIRKNAPDSGKTNMRSELVLPLKEAYTRRVPTVASRYSLVYSGPLEAAVPP